LAPLTQLRKFNDKNLSCVFSALLIILLIAVPVSSEEIKPYFDTYSTIIWKPVKQKNKVAILLGDELRISFGYVIPAKADDVYIKMFVGKYDVRSGNIVPIINKQEYVSTNGKTTVWRNFTIEVPDYASKLVLSAEIMHPQEDFIHNNNMSLEVPIYGDAKIVDVSLPTNVVESGSVLPIKVKIKNNQIGRSCLLSVEDLNLKNIIAQKDIEITEPEMTVSLDVNVPKASKSEEIHIWKIYLSCADWNEENNEKTVTLTIRSNNQFPIPGFESISAVVASIIVLSVCKKNTKMMGLVIHRVNRITNILFSHNVS